MITIGQDMAKAKVQAVERINEMIGARRAEYITTTPGQEAIYAAKDAEARRYLAMSPPPADLTGFPFLAAEVGITAPDAASLAQLWVQMAEQWRQVVAQMEQLRIGAIATIKVAATKGEVDSEVAFVKTTLEAL